MNDRCNCLEEVEKRWSEPFGKPIRFNLENGQMSVSEWAVKVYELNPSGTIKSKSISHLMINFCPICGCQLAEELGDEDI
jgi:hypothetical protein